MEGLGLLGQTFRNVATGSYFYNYARIKWGKSKSSVHLYSFKRLAKCIGTGLFGVKPSYLSSRGSVRESVGAFLRGYHKKNSHPGEDDYF